MKFNFVKIKNFRSFPDQETTLDLNFQGTKLIVGSNGTGKTTFFDAIIWGLYGKTPVAADEVVNRQTKKNCKVEVDFNVGSTRYSVVRYRKHEEKGDKLLFFINNKNKSSRVKAETQQMIDEAIQISYTAMTSSIILSSEMYSSFLRSKPSQRLNVLESILSLKEVNEYAKKLKKIRKPLQEEIQSLSDNKIKTESAINTLKISLSEYNENVKKLLISIKEEKEEINVQIENLNDTLKELRKVDVDEEIRKASASKEIKEHNEKINLKIIENKEKIKDLNLKVNELESLQEELNELKDIDIPKEQEHINKYNEIKEKKNELTLLINEEKSKLINIEDTKKTVVELKKGLSKKEEELNELKEHSDTCPLCKRGGMNEELSKEIMDKKKEEVSQYENKIEELSKKIKDADENNKSVQKEIDKYDFSLSNLKLPEVPKYSLDYLNNISNKKHELELNISNLSNDITRQKEINEECEKNIKELNKELKDVVEVSKYSLDYLNNLSEEIIKYENEIAENKNKLKECDVKAKSSVDKKYIENQKKNISKEEKNLRELNDTLKQRNYLDRHYDVLNEIFSNKEGGFKKFLINKMIKIFNEKVNFFMPFFFEDDIKIKFDRDLNETILLNDEEVNFQSFSSGQKTRLELAITFTLFIMVKIFFPSSVNLLVFDEILDNNLDKEGFDSVISIIDNMSHSNAVFIVSHQEYYKEKFNHHITMKMKDKYSYIADVA